MSIYSLYDVNGRVFSVLSLQQDDLLETMLASNGAVGCVEGAADAQTQYIENGRVMPRPLSRASLDGRTLSGLTVPCSIIINDGEYPCDETHVELEFDQPGRYRVTVRAWPQMDKEFEIENPPL
jgi:hypothetical protein|nr:hypothetical protein [Achromobacter ruhlandii]